VLHRFTQLHDALDVAGRFGHDFSKRPILNGETGGLIQPRQRHCVCGGNLQPALQWLGVRTSWCHRAKNGRKLIRLPANRQSRETNPLCSKMFRKSLERAICCTTYGWGRWNSDDGSQRGMAGSFAMARAARTVTRTCCAIPAYRNDG